MKNYRNKLMDKIQKHKSLEAGRRQFLPLVRPTAYVVASNIVLPVVNRERI